MSPDFRLFVDCAPPTKCVIMMLSTKIVFAKCIWETLIIVELLCNKGKFEMFSKKVNIIFFVFLLLFGITGIFLLISDPVQNSLLGTLGGYLQLSFVLAAVLLAIIGFQRNIRNEFFKSLFHGYLILLIFVASACIVLTIVHGISLYGHAALFLVISVSFSVLIFLLPITIALFFMRKVKSKKYRLIGYAIAIIVFATVFLIFHLYHYFILLQGSAPVSPGP